MSPRLALLLFPLALLSCRKTPESRPDAGAGAAARPATGDDFTMADLVAATRLDASVARLSVFSTEYKLALTFDRGSRLVEHTDRLAKLLDEAAAEADRALEGVRDPRDRSLAAPLVSAVRRWPMLLRDTRAELLGPPNVPAPRAAQALAATDDEVARALGLYRRFRAAWRISDAPGETPGVIDFLQARRALEVAETELGRALPEGGRAADAGVANPTAAGGVLDRVIGNAREAAGRVDGERQASARRWVETQGRALRSLVALVGPDGTPEERARRSLEYQVAKLEALEAVAEYTRLTARRTGAVQ